MSERENLPASGGFAGATARVPSWPAPAICGLIVLATLVAYFPALRGGFIWDDLAHVTRPDLQPLSGLRRIWCEFGATQQYYPLLHTAFWIEHRLWGDSPLGYHLFNVLLHATAACLLWRVLRRLVVPGAACAALLFALHPVGVESVAWISEQKNTLSAVLYLGAALVYLRFDRDRRPAQYGLALGLFALALLAKSVTATLPAALLVVFWWRRGRLAWRRDVFPLVPWLALGATMGLFTAWVERFLIGARGADFTLTFAQRCVLAGRAAWFYLGKLVWPADLVFIYPRWTIDATVWWQLVFPAATLAVAAGLAWLARRQRGPLAAFLFFVGTLFPALGFFDVYPFVFSYVADHFQYLAGIGILVAISAGVTHAAGIAPRSARAAGALLLAALGALTWRQCDLYRDARTLFAETLARNPGCAMAHNGLGEILLRDPARLPEAIAHFETALRLNPHDALTHNNLGAALARQPGRLSQAIAEYHAALQILPEFAGAHNNLGVALEQVPGRLPEAIAHLEEAVRIEPDSAEMQDNLGAALRRIPGRAAAATTHFEAAVRLDPDAAGMRNDLAVALLNTPGREREALAHFEAAVRLKPGSAEFQSNLGTVLVNLPGRRDEGIDHLRAAVRLDPGSAEARENLGNALALRPDSAPDALAQLEAAVRIDPASARAHCDLGRILLRTPGRLADAVSQFDAALRLDPNLADAHNDLGIALLQFPERSPDGIAHLETALRLDPQLAEAHYALGVALSASPDRRADAVAQLEAALRIRPDFTAAREALEQLRRAGP